VYLPAYTQDTGSIEMQSAPAITWGAVEKVFGPGARNIGTETISEGAPGIPAGKAMMRYLYPGDDPAKLDATQLSFAGFLIKGRPIAIDEKLNGNDAVASVRMFESVRVYR
jgi:hypothetical protein